MDTIVYQEFSNDIEFGIRLGSIFEANKQDWLEDEDILHFITVFRIIENNDTIFSDPGFKEWRRFDSGKDWNYMTRSYLLEIKDDDFK
jgi:hypothetical protein